MELNCVEHHLKDAIGEHYKDRLLTIGRTAHITEGTKPGKRKGKLSVPKQMYEGMPIWSLF